MMRSQILKVLFWVCGEGTLVIIFGYSIQLSFNPLATYTKYLDTRESAIFYPHLDFTQLFFDMISV